MSKTISIVLIEDNRMLREGLATLIREQPGFKILAASANIIEALQKVRDAKPRIVLVDFGLQNHDSLRLTATVHREVPQARVIVMGLLPLHEDIADFVRAGAAGFVAPPVMGRMPSNRGMSTGRIGSGDRRFTPVESGSDLPSCRPR